ncbi:MAG: prepilin-type N-terminal cleavage/methylation domain-containing protein [Planctomycetes bacterium]|nr:prepilin-type N-terminal cleavage/methylation domain-containing protein [Planctomycetota bacterium]
MMRHPKTTGGFTLLEVLIAVTITATVMVTVGTTFRVLLETRELVDELSESTEAGPRILNLIERDLRGIWTYNVGNNAVFRGRDMDVGSFEADRMDFLTTTDAVGFVLNDVGAPVRPSLCEVGYWFRRNPRYRDLIEMWRREDPLVDRDLVTQGSFQLVHDRIKTFKVTYFKELGSEAEEMLEWDSSENDKLPRRIKIEFTIERRRGSRNIVSDAEIDDFERAEKTYVRHFVFDKGMTDILRAGTAMIPLLPGPPSAEPSGPGGTGGPLGPGGPGGPVVGPGGPAGAVAGELGEGQPGGRGRGRVNGDGTPDGGRGQPGRGSGNRPNIPQNLPQGFNLTEILGGRGGTGGLGGLFGNR